jgi:cbb3-type cytochrome oxidase cytochrome c subunit
VGPDLSGMGSHHPAEYFAESIINPNRVIVDGPGYTGPDGRSRMPEYSDSLTIRQLVDLVAYLNSLKSDNESMGHHHHGH